MKTFAARRVRNLCLFALSAALLLLAFAVCQVSLRPTAWYTGWLLGGLILVLTCYNLFKKVPFLPLGTSAAWLQFHIYLGLLSIVVFALHAGPSLPYGPVGWVLAVLYVAVAGSGLAGLFMSRTIPALLRAQGAEVIYEQIPVLRRRLQQEAEQLIVGGSAEFHSTFIAEYYCRRLKPFFDAPRYFWLHVLRVSGPRHALLTDIDAQARYLNEPERALLRQLRALVERKDDLDFQHAMQGVLKCWLFVHIPLTYGLVLFSIFHVLVMYTYSGVVR